MPVFTGNKFGFGAASSIPIVTSGLVLNLDAGNTASYPGSGTTWTDLSGANNATLINGVGYDSNNNGYLTFDGVDDHATIADVDGVTDFTNSNNYTVDFWVYLNSTQNNTGNTDNDVVEKWSGVGAYPYTFRYIRSNQTMSVAVYNGTSANAIDIQISSNTWWHICGTFNWSGSLLTLYGNGGSVTNTVTLNLTGTITNSSLLYLMRRGDAGATNYATGRISALKIYNRALTSSEVTQNFNALRGRFGI